MAMTVIDEMDPSPPKRVKDMVLGSVFRDSQNDLWTIGRDKEGSYIYLLWDDENLNWERLDPGENEDLLNLRVTKTYESPKLKLGPETILIL